MRDVIELVVSLGETTLEQRFVSSGKHRIHDIDLDADAWQLGGDDIGSSWVRCKSGLIEVAARRTSPPRQHALGTAIGDRRSAGYIAASLAVHLVVWAIATDHPPEVTIRVDPPQQIGTRVAGNSPRATERNALETGDSPDVERDGGGSPTMGVEGAAGGASAREKGHARLSRREVPAVTREMAIESARNAGILGSSSLKGQGFAAIVGTADPASGFDKTDTQGPLYGGTGEAHGSFGLGRSGFGDSAGCNGSTCNGLIGTGHYGTISNGTSVGDYWGGGRIGAGGARPRGPEVFLCAGPTPCIAIGGLDKAIIRRYIKRNLSKIQYCYEKELLVTPELDGSVETHFLIQVDGTVKAAEAKGVSLAVSSCIASVIKNIEFPRSHDGSSTEVHYPFTFRRLGS